MCRCTRFLSIALALALSFARAAIADVIEVPTHFPTIQQAVDNAAPGDEIVILPGTYLENVEIAGHSSLIIRGANDAASTIVDGQFRAPVFDVTDGHRIAIRTLTIRHGDLGVRIYESDPVQVKDAIIEENTSTGDGGGIYSVRSQVLIEGNRIRDNSANVSLGLDGGGVFLYASSGVVSRNRIERNRAHEAAGLSINLSTDPSLVVSENLILNNEALLFGGGMFINVNTHPEVRSNTAVGNSAQVAGGGAFYMDSSAPVFERNIFVANAAPDGGGIHAFGLGAPVFECNDVWENSGGNYTGQVVDPTGRDGNISLDPLFCGPLLGDYSLAQNSPCAPGHSPPGCDLIGALPVGCGPVAVETTTWGSLKSLYSATGQ